MNRTLAPAALILALAWGGAFAAEPAELLELAKAAPQPPWPAGDERGMANTLGAATTQRCGLAHVAARRAQRYEASLRAQ